MRAVLAVIIGYVAMIVVVFCSLMAAYFIMGTEKAFKPGVYDVSNTWIVTSAVLGLIAAVIGGMTCAAIARAPAPPKVLAALVLVLGLLMAIPSYLPRDETKPNVRTGDVLGLEAMKDARTPPLAATLNPFIGLLGTLIGARMIRQPTAVK